MLILWCPVSGEAGLFVVFVEGKLLSIERWVGHRGWVVGTWKLGGVGVGEVVTLVKCHFYW